MPRFLFRALPLCAALLTFGTGVASAQNAPAPFQAAPLFRPSDISFRVLPNGIRSIVKRAPGASTLSVQVWVRAGSRYESASESGVAHLIETAALRASKNQPARANGDGGLAGALRNLGGDAGALTSRDATFYSATVAPEFAANAMRALSDTVLRPDLSDSSVEEAKLGVAEDLARRSLDAVSSASDLAYATAFVRHPYRRAAWGDDESVAALTGNRARAFFKQQYVGENTTVVVVGDMDAGRAQAMVRSFFASLPRGTRARTPVVVEGPIKTREVSRRATLGRDAVALAWRASGIQNPRDVVALDTLLALWREGVDANLRRRLLRGGAESKSAPPLAAAFEVDYLTQRDPGLFLITLAGTSDSDAAAKATLAEIERARRGGLSPDEVRLGKELLRRQYIEQGETPAGQAGALGFYDMISSYQFAVNYLSLCAQVSGADLERVARRYFSPSNMVRAEITPVSPPDSPDIPRPGDPNIITARWMKR